MIRIGVVGLGAMGKHHVRVYSELGCQIQGVVDTDQHKADLIAKQYKVCSYKNYNTLFDKVDAVSIAVPTSLHSLVTCDFLRRGIHCLVEKPIASTLDEAEEMIETGRKNKTKLMVGHIERFNPAVQKLKQLIDQGHLGKLVIVSTRRVGPFVPRIRDVGIIIDTATHDIDVIRFLINKDPENIFAKTGRLIAQKEDHAIIVLNFGNSVGCVEVNWLTPHKVRTLVATGSEGICYLDYIKQELQLFTKSSSQQVSINRQEPLKLELAHFLKCIEEDLKPTTDGKDAAKVLELAIKAIGSS